MTNDKIKELKNKLKLTICKECHNENCKEEFISKEIKLTSEPIIYCLKCLNYKK